jgi:predicted XRE-type DNA-binding protein
MSDAPTTQQKLMQRAVAELMKVHRLSERDAASIVITVTSVARLEPVTPR